MTEKPDIGASWDTYWAGASGADAYTGGGSTHPDVVGFWHALFESLPHSGPLLDVASGNGAIAAAATATLGEALSITCVDISAAAIETLTQRLPQVTGVVADAASIPLPDAHFAMVTSQFGLEYAGLEAADELVRLLADGGTLALLLHFRDGLIYRQCDTNQQAIKELQQSRFVELCSVMFREGYAAGRGESNTYREAAATLVPALRRVEQILAQYGLEVADNTVVRLYRDIRTVHQGAARYDEQEILGWLQRMQQELEAYRGRMQSMCDAALGENEFSALCHSLAEQGIELRRRDVLSDSGQALPLAWALVGTKRETLQPSGLPGV